MAKALQDVTLKLGNEDLLKFRATHLLHRTHQLLQIVNSNSSKLSKQQVSQLQTQCLPWLKLRRQDEQHHWNYIMSFAEALFWVAWSWSFARHRSFADPSKRRWTTEIRNGC